MPWQERPGIVNHIGLYYMRVVELVPARDGAFNCASLWGRANEAQFSLDVGLLFFVGQSSPGAEVRRIVLLMIIV